MWVRLLVVVLVLVGSIPLHRCTCAHAHTDCEAGGTGDPEPQPHHHDCDCLTAPAVSAALLLGGPVVDEFAPVACLQSLADVPARDAGVLRARPDPRPSVTPARPLYLSLRTLLI